jgi:hypothetical protein
MTLKYDEYIHLFISNNDCERSFFFLSLSLSLLLHVFQTMLMDVDNPIKKYKSLVLLILFYLHPFGQSLVKIYIVVYPIYELLLCLIKKMIPWKRFFSFSYISWMIKNKNNDDDRSFIITFPTSFGHMSTCACLFFQCNSQSKSLLL